mmetsp:Transcript_11085/g.15436  ORF Transcript_11085/g.15436 Transcript_11085/m.15436 type:complete len:306 (+) Transcript_11085:120-1037(+)|eukprot:CAMPEP_0184481264 /NCGR_PEP_ID=MMETSP0113_2-20130426/2816_1 /TAXON_ID=91329 /ORGANISM="Norrisiella sphaerica, Strain BC52" /LENGTH=305 /DNA_ID=CAMNT_0026860283 /DNA_START=39 /DNA_END=956 /DNA_ORIENTATION=-
MDVEHAHEDDEALDGEEARLEMELAMIRSKIEKVRLRKRLAQEERHSRQSQSSAGGEKGEANGAEVNSNSGIRMASKPTQPMPRPSKAGTPSVSSQTLLNLERKADGVGMRRLGSGKSDIDAEKYRQTCAPDRKPVQTTESVEAKIRNLMEKAPESERKQIMLNKQALAGCGIRVGGATKWGNNPLLLLKDLRSMETLQDALVKGNLQSYLKVKKTAAEETGDFILREVKRKKRQKTTPPQVRRGKEAAPASANTNAATGEGDGEDARGKEVLENLFSHLEQQNSGGPPLIEEIDAPSKSPSADL